MENTYTPLKEYLGTQGKDFSMANLAALATERGVQGYRGSDEQNRQLSTLLTPKVSTTTISNQNKVQQVPKMVNTLNTMSQGRGLTSDGTTTRYADGTIYNDNYQEPTLPPNTTPIYGTVNGQSNRIIGYNSSNIATGQQIPTYFDSGTSTPSYSPEEQQFNDLLSQMRASTDAQTARTIASIQNRFETLRSQQKEINRAQQAGVQTALLTGGVTGKGSGAQYTPISSENIMTAQLNYGVQKLAELDSQEQDLIIEAQQAGESQNFKLLETKLAQVEKKREEKAKEAADLNKKIAEQNEKARQALIQSSRDNALADLYSQGVTDPTEMLAALNATGGDFTLKEINEGLDNIAKANGTNVSKMSNDVAEFYALKKEKGGLPVSILGLPSTAEQIAAYIKLKTQAETKAKATSGTGGVSSSGQYVQGTDPQAEKWALQISNKQAKLSDVPSAMRTRVVMAMGASPQQTAKASELKAEMKDILERMAKYNNVVIGANAQTFPVQSQRFGDTAAAIADAERLSALLTTENIQIMKGLGSMSNIEFGNIEKIGSSILGRDKDGNAYFKGNRANYDREVKRLLEDVSNVPDIPKPQSSFGGSTAQDMLNAPLPGTEQKTYSPSVWSKLP